MSEYHIHNIYAYKPSYIALLLIGLDYNSRFFRKVNQMNYKLSDVLLMNVLDGVNLILWSKTKDAEKGRNKPESIYSKLNREDNNNQSVVSFNSIEDYERYIKQIKEGG